MANKVGGARDGAGRPRRKFCVSLDAELVDRLKEMHANHQAYVREHLPNDADPSMTIDDYFAVSVAQLIKQGKFEC